MPSRKSRPESKPLACSNLSTCISANNRASCTPGFGVGSDPSSSNSVEAAAATDALSATYAAKIWAGPSQTTLSVRPRMEMTVLFAGTPICDDEEPSADCLTPTGSRNKA